MITGCGSLDIISDWAILRSWLLLVFIESNNSLNRIYCLFYYVIWFDFMPINVIFVFQFPPMDSENDLTLFAQITYVNVLHWIVGLYYYGFLVNEGIGLILVIQTFYPSTLSVLYNKDVYPTSSIVSSTSFPFNIHKSH